jgi:hypothetical protein
MRLTPPSWLSQVSKWSRADSQSHPAAAISSGMKSPKKAGNLRNWRVPILRQRAHNLGTIQAPDQRVAEAEAVKLFGLRSNASGCRSGAGLAAVYKARLRGAFLLPVRKLAAATKFPGPQHEPPDLKLWLSSSFLGILDTQPTPHLEPRPAAKPGHLPCPERFAMSIMEELRSCPV